MGMNKQKLLLLEFWRKAYREGEAVLELDDKAMAAKTRFALYEVAKLVKKGRVGDFEQELVDAVQEVQLAINGNVVVARNVARGRLTELLEGVLGGTVKTEAEREKEKAEESLKRLMEKMGAGAGDGGEGDKGKYL